MMVDFHDLHRRLMRLLRERIHNGELTERGLSRRTGISQPHIHNVLKGKRLFSTEAADVILHDLDLDLLDLLDQVDLLEWQQRR